MSETTEEIPVLTGAIPLINEAFSETVYGGDSIFIASNSSLKGVLPDSIGYIDNISSPLRDTEGERIPNFNDGGVPTIVCEFPGHTSHNVRARDIVSQRDYLAGKTEFIQKKVDISKLTFPLYATLDGEAGSQGLITVDTLYEVSRIEITEPTRRDIAWVKNVNSIITSEYWTFADLITIVSDDDSRIIEAKKQAEERIKLEEEQQKREEERQRKAIEGRDVNKILMKEALQDVFPDLWDWKSEDLGGTGSEDREASYGVNQIVIRFPEIVIKNGNPDGQRTLKDLFVRIPLKQDLRLSRRLEGMRMTQYNDEVNVGYTHSHLTTHLSLGMWGKFCLGTTAIMYTVDDLKSSFDINKFTMLLMQIDDYVRWESIAGGPHIRMSNINSGTRYTSSSPSNDYLRATYRYFIAAYSRFPVKFANGKFTVDKTNQTFKDMLVPIVRNNLGVEYLRRQDPLTGFISDYQDNNVLSANALSNMNRECREINYIFKEEVIDGKILDINASETTEERPQLPVIVHPAFSDYIAKTLEKEMTIYYLKTQENE